jgi:phenylalanyl-tRNA synthetase alpha chain
VRLQEKEYEKAMQEDWIDITRPGKRAIEGSLHPLTKTIYELEDIFGGMGFEVVTGPQIETEWYNFDALNIPPNHPARDLFDTFWLKPKNKNLLLRTHTSSVQLRYMQKNHPPIRIIAPGRVFRHEATDASHEAQFYQIEGLMVDAEISVANFRAVIFEALRKFFKKDISMRLRPSYFPFVEPGFEVDIACIACDGRGCVVCGKTGWLELMGAGMVHPNVLDAAGYNPKNLQGFAFGIGIDRLTMMKYKIDDIRLFYASDLRFLNQFR